MDKSCFNVSTASAVSSLMMILVFDCSSSESFLQIDDESSDRAMPGTRGMNADNRLEIDSAFLPAALWEWSKRGTQYPLISGRGMPWHTLIFRDDDSPCIFLSR